MLFDDWLTFCRLNVVTKTRSFGWWGRRTAPYWGEPKTHPLRMAGLPAIVIEARLSVAEPEDQPLRWRALHDVYKATLLQSRNSSVQSEVSQSASAVVNRLDWGLWMNLFEFKVMSAKCNRKEHTLNKVVVGLDSVQYSTDAIDVLVTAPLDGKNIAKETRIVQRIRKRISLQFCNSIIPRVDAAFSGIMGL